MRFLSEQDKQRISDAIRVAESRTSGELVSVVAHASDGYRYIPLLWASAIALLLPGVVYVLIEWMTEWRHYGGWFVQSVTDFSSMYLLQILVFIALSLLLNWQPIKMRLIPVSTKHARARGLAHQQFFDQGLHLTRDHTGILFFVSVAEHYVEVIADHGISTKVDQSVWDDVIERFIVNVKAERVADGFIEAIELCGDTLAQHCPPREDDINELGDMPIELPNYLIEI